MNAKVAERASLAALKRKQLASAKLRRQQDRDHEKQVAAVIKAEYRGALVEMRTSIREATQHGVRSVKVKRNDTIGQQELFVKCLDRLRMDGYSCGHIAALSRSDDMGDYNAPCHVTVRWLEADISW